MRSGRCARVPDTREGSLPSHPALVQVVGERGQNSAPRGRVIVGLRSAQSYIHAPHKIPHRTIT